MSKFQTSVRKSEHHTAAPWPALGEDGKLESPIDQNHAQPAFLVVSTYLGTTPVHSVTMSQLDYARARLCVNLFAEMEAAALTANAAPDKPVDEVKTVYCIALEGDQVTGVNWYYSDNTRDDCLGSTGAELEVPFNLIVPVGASSDEITDLADQAGWNKSYLPKETMT